MALPVLKAPTYELTLPSNSKKIKFRSFLVKEEKLLMIANETGDVEERRIAISQIIDNCTFGKLDADSMPIFDVEYLFLKLRSKSIGEFVDVRVLCPDDKETYAEVSVNLEDIKCRKPKKRANILSLNDDVGVIMKYPTISTSITESSSVIDVIVESIESIFDGETVFDATDYNETELTEFVESMTQKQLQNISDFYSNMPKVSLTVKVLNPKTKVESDVSLEGLESFF
jgi:hypothetical protein